MIHKPKPLGLRSSVSGFCKSHTNLNIDLLASERDTLRGNTIENLGYLANVRSERDSIRGG